MAHAAVQLTIFVRTAIGAVPFSEQTGIDPHQPNFIVGDLIQHVPRRRVAARGVTDRSVVCVAEKRIRTTTAFIG
jgi:hypothetical protein